MIKKILKWSAIILVVGFAIIQLVRPARTNPATDASQTIQAHLNVPAEVDAIFKRSCNDCHSNETLWPWYSHLAPVSWLVARDVNEGRRYLNFSVWGSYDADEAEDKLEEIEEEVSKGGMPLWIYLPAHPEAKLSDQDKRTIRDWVKSERARVKEDKEEYSGRGRGRGRGGRDEHQ